MHDLLDWTYNSGGSFAGLPELVDDLHANGQHYVIIVVSTVELWSLELACLEHQGSLKLVCWSWQFRFTFNVKMHPRLEQ